MSQSLEQLQRQHTTLGSIGGIVRTMKTLAAINAAPYEQAANAIANYQQIVEQGFACFAFAGPELQALRQPPRQKLLISFGSDHGLCGNYNELMADCIHQHLQRQTMSAKLLCIGSQLEQALLEYRITPAKLLWPPASAEGITRLASEVVSLIVPLAGTSSLNELAIDLAYTERAGHGSRHPIIVPLLPLPAHLLQKPARWPGKSLPAFTLPPGQMLAALLRNHVFCRVYRALAEAMVTENAARLALMQQAGQSVDERLFELNRQINHQRQENITNELMDVIIGHL